MLHKKLLCKQSDHAVYAMLCKLQLLFSGVSGNILSDDATRLHHISVLKSKKKTENLDERGVKNRCRFSQSPYMMH